MSIDRRPVTAGNVVRFVSARERQLDSALQMAGTTFAEIVIEGDRDIRQWLRNKELRQEALDSRRAWDRLAQQMGFRSLASMARHIRRAAK